MRAEWDREDVAAMQARMNDVELALDASHVGAFDVFRRVTDGLARWFAVVGIPTPHLVDIGAGSGIYGVLLGRTQPQWQYTAYDGSSAAVAQCRKRGLAARVADVDAVPLAGADVILASKSLEYAPDPPRLLHAVLAAMTTNQWLILHRAEYGNGWRTDPTYCGQHSRQYLWLPEDLARAADILPAADLTWDRTKHTIVFGHHAREITWQA